MEGFGHRYFHSENSATPPQSVMSSDTIRLPALRPADLRVSPPNVGTKSRCLRIIRSHHIDMTMVWPYQMMWYPRLSDQTDRAGLGDILIGIYRIE